ncbi:MAG: hypothetical protein KIT25_19650 [Enhydrobacter sp.]|nr:MAG: hypothetical protein KIT25_19650 [Enhydrobacter sp.]
MKRLIAAALLALPLQVQAQSKSCGEFRDSIIRMESESVRPPGWLSVDSYLRLIYQAYCIDHPTPEMPVEYWYRADGTSTGVKVGEGRPPDAAYATTKDVGDHCLSIAGPLIRTKQGRTARAGIDPSICALLNGGLRDRSNPPKAAPLPPFAVGLDGGPYDLNPQCLGVLNQFGNDLAFDDERADQRPGWLATLQGHCPDLLAAIERRTGARAEGNAQRFWQGFGQLVLSGFAPPGQTQPSVGDVAADPGWQKMCRQAEVNMNKCAESQANMRSLKTTPWGTTGQAGAFNECRILYGQVVGMCNGTTGAAARTAGTKTQRPSTAARQPPAPQPALAAQMSPQCQKLVSDYVAAAQAGDGAKSVAAHGALKRAGGCGILEQAGNDLAPPAGGDPRFVRRGETPHVNNTVVACEQNPAACSAAIEQLRQGASPEAAAAMFANAINIGLRVGMLAGQGVLMMQQQQMQSSGGGGGGTVQQGPAGVRNTYGQGSGHPQGLPANRSTISGTTR